MPRTALDLLTALRRGAPLALALAACSAEAAAPEVPHAAAPASAAPARDYFEEHAKLYADLASTLGRLGAHCSDAARALDRWREERAAQLAEIRAGMAGAPPAVAERGRERFFGWAVRTDASLRDARDRCTGHDAFEAAFARALPHLNEDASKRE